MAQQKKPLSSGSRLSEFKYLRFWCQDSASKVPALMIAQDGRLIKCGKRVLLCNTLTGSSPLRYIYWLCWPVVWLLFTLNLSQLVDRHNYILTLLLTYSCAQIVPKASGVCVQ